MKYLIYSNSKKKLSKLISQFSPFLIIVSQIGYRKTYAYAALNTIYHPKNLEHASLFTF